MPLQAVIVLVIFLIFAGVVFFGAPYVPLRRKQVEEAFSKLYKLSKKDTLVDLGAGDGKVLKIAARCGAKAYGVEINPCLVLWTKISCKIAKQKNVHVACGNMYTYKFPDETTVVYVFGDTRDMEKIVRHIKAEARRLQKKLYLISFGFETKDAKLVRNVGAYFLYKL